MALKANYETVMVISMKQGEEGIQALIEKFKALIEKNATLQGVDEWGKRKLAYLINKESEGYYVLMNFESEADFPKELDRVYKITDGIMRSLIVRKADDEEVVVAPKKPARAKKSEVKEEEPAEEAVVEAVEEAVEETAEAPVAEEPVQEDAE